LKAAIVTVKALQVVPSVGVNTSSFKSEAGDATNRWYVGVGEIPTSGTRIGSMCLIESGKWLLSENMLSGLFVLGS
jgi:hypothetical protein